MNTSWSAGKRLQINVSRNANLRERVASVMLSILGCVKIQYLVSTLIHSLKGVYFKLKKRERQLLLRVGSYKLTALHKFYCWLLNISCKSFPFLCITAFCFQLIS